MRRCFSFVTKIFRESAAHTCSSALRPQSALDQFAIIGYIANNIRTTGVFFAWDERLRVAVGRLATRALRNA